MLGDLLYVLVELLAVDPDQFPVGVGGVAVERAGGAVAEVLGVAAAGVVGIDVLRPGDWTCARVSCEKNISASHQSPNHGIGRALVAKNSKNKRRKETAESQGRIQRASSRHVVGFLGETLVAELSSQGERLPAKIQSAIGQEPFSDMDGG